MRWVCAVVLVSIVGGCADCSKSEAPQAPSSEPLDGKLVDAGGVRLNLHCMGKGSPVVVFDSGLGAGGSVWRHVQSNVAKLTRACAYDRAGLGRSDPPPRPHGQHQMARELRTLLDNAREVGPYVLVGHSMGAANVRWFLHDNASDVVGVVLVDPTTADSFHENLAKVAPGEAAMFWKNVQQLEGLTQESMTRGYDELGIPSGGSDAFPLVILTAGKPEAELSARHSSQAALRALSSNTVHLTVEGSGHNIHVERPNQVARAITAVIQAARTKKSLQETEVSGEAASSP